MISDEQVEILREAMHGNVFPRIAYDFETEVELPEFAGYPALEEHIRDQLTAGVRTTVKHGLANIVYLGWAQQPVRAARVGDFLTHVTDPHLDAFMTAVEADPDSLGDRQYRSAPVWSYFLMSARY